jgi:hypothetical protein
LRRKDMESRKNNSGGTGQHRRKIKKEPFYIHHL